MTFVQRRRYAYRIVIVIVSMAIFTRSAWISDDALISLRTALNLTNGWGPGFNATESVQAYTHPLWFLLWSAIGSSSGQWIIGILALSVMASAATVALLVSQTTSLARITVLAALLWLSNSIVDYTTSGLENPLAFLGVAILFIIAVQLPEQQGRMQTLAIALIGLTAAGILLTRLDLAVLIAPPLLYLLWTYRKSIRAWIIAGGTFLLPLIVWFIWTYLTYAALLPNTFAAKTNSLIPRSELVVNGFRYLWVTFVHDPITFLIIISALVLPLALGSTLLRVWAAGIGLYLSYIVWIGGDFMAGRFTAITAVVGLFILARVPLHSRTRTQQPSVTSSTTLGFVIALSLLAVMQAFGTQSTALVNPQSPRWSWGEWANVADERGEYVQRGWTLADLLVIGESFERGESFRSTASRTTNWPQGAGQIEQPTAVTQTCGQLGITGLEAGPTVHVIDECALADRYLAEQTFVPLEPFAWRPGHLPRVIPEGYQEAVATGDPTRLTDPTSARELEALWEKIR